MHDPVRTRLRPADGPHHPRKVRIPPDRDAPDTIFRTAQGNVDWQRFTAKSTAEGLFVDRTLAQNRRQDEFSPIALDAQAHHLSHTGSRI